jgi:ATP-dependent DNA ligase
VAPAEPFSFEPMLCESAERPPEVANGVTSVKLDGFSAIDRKSGRSARLWSRIQKDFTRRFPDVKCTIERHRDRRRSRGPR